MRYVKPALIFVALATAAACSKRPPTPLALPATPAPTVDPDRRAALALLRTRLEVRTARSRVRLPADAHIRLEGMGARRYAFTTAYYEYVPASTLPWVFEARGTVDVRAGRVEVSSLVAEAAVEAPLTGATPAVGPVLTPLDPRPKL